MKELSSSRSWKYNRHMKPDSAVNPQWRVTALNNNSSTLHSLSGFKLRISKSSSILHRYWVFMLLFSVSWRFKSQKWYCANTSLGKRTGQSQRSAQTACEDEVRTLGVLLLVMCHLSLAQSELAAGPHARSVRYGPPLRGQRSASGASSYHEISRQLLQQHGLQMCAHRLKVKVYQSYKILEPWRANTKKCWT